MCCMLISHVTASSSSIFHQYLQNASWDDLYFVEKNQNEQTLGNHYNSVRKEKHVNGRETERKDVCSTQRRMVGKQV